MNVSLREAATRVFSNSAGSYSANVGLAIENGGWEGEQQLQDQFLSRKGFAFNADRPGQMDQNAGMFKVLMTMSDCDGRPSARFFSWSWAPFSDLAFRTHQVSCASEKPRPP
jgi:hypothetical protein